MDGLIEDRCYMDAKEYHLNLGLKGKGCQAANLVFQGRGQIY